MQQDIYNYIESLEKRDATKTSIRNQEEEEVQFNKPQEPLVINILKQEFFELETLNRYIKNENQALKAHNEIQIAKSHKLLLHLNLWYKKNMKLKKKKRALQRQVINLKYKILMTKPRMEVTGKKVKKMNLDVLAEVSKEMQ